MSARNRLPNRRPNISAEIVWRQHRLHLCIGLAKDGTPQEVFLRTGRPDSDFDEIIDDLAVVVSRALQFGDTIEAIAKSLGRRSSGEASSVVGVILNALVDLASGGRGS